MNKRILSIPASITLGITARAKQMAAEGRSVCSFAAGEPDFDTPGSIKAAAIEALSAGKTKYAPVPGLPDLRSEIAAKLQRDNGLTYKPEQIVVSNGAKHSLFNIAMALCNEGDEVIIPSPYWLSYPEMVKVAGGVPVFVAGSESNGFKILPADLEAAVTDRTRAIIINSPSNPTGAVYAENELRALVDIALAHGLTIISDEIYEKMVYDGTAHISVASLSSAAYDSTVTVNGFSKCSSMTGWRLGYLAGAVELVKAITALQSHSTSGANTFAQYGAIAALNSDPAEQQGMLDAFTERRAFLCERLSNIDGVSCPEPKGAFYVFPNISSFGLDSVTFAEQLIEKEAVAVVPGSAFGADEHIRMSYACSMDNLAEGLDRIERFVAALR